MTNQTETTVTITPVTGAPDALLHIYPGQDGPQDCYIELDLRDGSMTASYNGEIGNAIPSTVWHGIVRRWTIPPLQPVTVNALMEQIAPLAQRIIDGTEIERDHNGNPRVQWTDDARAAEEEIAGDANNYGGILPVEPEASDVYWRDADNWLEPMRGDVLEMIRAGRSLDAIADELDGDGSSEETPVLVGLMPYLERMRDEMGEEEAG